MVSQPTFLCLYVSMFLKDRFVQLYVATMEIVQGHFYDFLDIFFNVFQIFLFCEHLGLPFLKSFEILLEETTTRGEFWNGKSVPKQKI